MGENVEKINGNWNGLQCSIKKSWGSHEFTADERTALFNGEIIEFDYTSKNGNTFKVRGKLDKNKWTDDAGNEHESVQFTKIDEPGDERFEGIWKGEKVKIKRIWGTNSNWSGHRFTDEEIAKLLNDETIEFDAISKKAEAKHYTAKGKLERQTFTKDDGSSFEYVGFTLKFD